MYDVAIIGGGISGSSLLYALSRYNLKVVLLEKENDVGVATTKANSAIIHAGYDPLPGTRMAKYNVEGNRLIQQLCADLDILYINTGSLVVAFEEEDRKQLETLYQQGISNQVPGIKILEKEELFTKEPSLSSKALFGLYAPSAGIVNPWELASAQAEAAIEGGAEVRLSSPVTAINKTDQYFILQTPTETVEAKFIVNASGVSAAEVCSMVETPDFSIHPNRGQYYLLDTTMGSLVKHVVFQCPTKLGKGVLVAPTVHGNLIVGPNAEDAQDVSTTTSGLVNVRAAALKSVPAIQFSETIRNFAGLRAVANIDDFIVGESKNTPGFFNIAGIKSPGLTAAPAIAQNMVKMLEKSGLILTLNPHFVNKRSVFRFKKANKSERAKAIEQNPLYGNIVCRCATVTEGEIVDALHRPLAPRSIDGVKRRCNTGMGRCQGGFCGPKVQAIIARELGISQEKVPLDRDGMYVIIGETKDQTLWNGGTNHEA